MIYYYISKIHRSLIKPEKLDAKTIAIGNFSFGGTGKTPFTIFLANKLKQRYNVIVLSRGYKRKNKHVQLIRDKDIDVSLVGDEPYLIHLKTGLKVLVYKDRFLASKIGIELFKPHILLFDDALQYWRIDFDKKILIINYNELRGWKVFPFGKYREPITEIKRVDFIVINFKFSEFFEISEFYGKPAVSIRYKIINPYNFKDVVAFCGIADSRSFKNIVSKTFNLIYFKEFPDHHYYKESDLKPLRKFNLPIITTLKDFVKIENKENIYYLDIDLQVYDSQRILSML